MGERRDPVVRATRAAAGYRLELKRIRALLVEANDRLIRERVADRLEDVDDFQLLIGRDLVTVEGRVDFELLELRVRELLLRKPHLAKRHTESPRRVVGRS